jgi:outer membrane lipoprotein carrier protein
VVLWGLAALATTAAADPPSLPEASEIVRLLQERYDRTSDFTADFVQTVHVATLERTLQSRGTVEFKRPGRMRWEFLAPERQTIVADGETLWIYQPDQHQVLKAPFRAAFRSTTPVSFLLGVGKLAQDFRASVLGGDDRTVRLRLEPKIASDLGTLVLAVNRQTGDIQGAEVTDPLGNVTELSFSNFRREVGLDDARFRFEIPEGADVVESPLDS